METSLRRVQERLERGEVIEYPVCPFPIAEGEDRDFLLAQRLSGKAHKNIGYDPATGRLRGSADRSSERREWLRRLLADFARNVTEWVSKELPGYAATWQRDRVSFRPEEEAGRKLRLTARNDLLHVDAFPNRPTRGYRILRVFVNINRTEPRVWRTGEPFAELLAKYGPEAGLPYGLDLPLATRVGWKIQGLFNPKRRERTVYDRFMLGFHNFLKRNEDFQRNGRQTHWEFQPGAAWMCFTDTATHAVLSGRAALEHSYFVAPEALVLPEESPASLLEKACGRPVLRRVA